MLSSVRWSRGRRDRGHQSVNKTRANFEPITRPVRGKRLAQDKNSPGRIRGMAPCANRIASQPGLLLKELRQVRDIEHEYQTEVQASNEGGCTSPPGNEVARSMMVGHTFGCRLGEEGALLLPAFLNSCRSLAERASCEPPPRGPDPDWPGYISNRSSASNDRTNKDQTPVPGGGSTEPLESQVLDVFRRSR